MKYIKKIPEENKEYTGELLRTGWKKLKEPKLSLVMLIAIPVGILLMLLNIKYCLYFFPKLNEIINYSENSFAIKFKLGIWQLILYLIITVLFLILHEFIHLLFVPNFFKSKRTFWGMRLLYFFTYTEEEMSKFRMAVIFIAPLLFLSFIFPVILNILGIMNGFIMFLCVLNAGGSCVDVFYTLLILFKIPNGSIVKNNGAVTFYKKR